MEILYSLNLRDNNAATKNFVGDYTQTLEAPNGVVCTEMDFTPGKVYTIVGSIGFLSIMTDNPVEITISSKPTLIVTSVFAAQLSISESQFTVKNSGTTSAHVIIVYA